MLAKICSAAVNGIEAYPVEVEVHTGFGDTLIVIVGLADAAVKLLDAYQEGLIALADLRKRSPEIKKKLGALEQEQQNLKVRVVEDKRWIEVSNSMETFLGHLNETAQTMTPVEKQKLLRMLVKQITVGKDLITVHHSIPTGPARGSAELTSYPLCTRGQLAGAGQHLSALRAGPVV